VFPWSLKPDPSLVTLGEAVKALRKERELTQAQLAERAGVDITCISRIERGERNPTICALCRICRGLGIRMPALFARIEELEGGSAP
jgi:transcriptional regulator with XRE-family HTH domain